MEGKQEAGKYLQSLLHGRDEPVEHQDGDTRAQEQQNLGLELKDSIIVTVEAWDPAKAKESVCGTWSSKHNLLVGRTCRD